MSTTGDGSELAGMAEDSRKLVAVVYADMVGYSRLIGLDDAGTLARIRSLRASLLDPLIARHGGNLVQTAGDSFLVLFDSILEAVRCAVALQQRLPRHPANDGHKAPIRFRVGIEMGDVIADAGDYHGEGIIVAVRLEGACPPGAICISRAVHEYVQGRIPAKGVPVGALELKNITRKVEAVVLEVDPAQSHQAVEAPGFGKLATTAGVLAAEGQKLERERAMQRATLRADDFRQDTASLHGLPTGYDAAHPGSTGRSYPSTEGLGPLSVLVLPLRSVDGSDAHERLAWSVTADIVTDLTKYLRDLALGEARVAFNDSRLAPGETGLRHCEADYVLRGSVQGSRRTRVNLQLMNAASGVCIWAARCELDGQRDQIAGLVHGISNVVVMDVGRRIMGRPTAGLTSHAMLMRGQAWLLRPSSASIRHKALACFEGAIAMDPGSVGAKLGIATVLASDLSNGWSQTIEQDEARIESLLTEVFDTDTDSALGHGINGILRRLQGRLEESRVELEMAMELAPHHAMAASQLGMTLVYCGRPDAALRYFERGVRLARHAPQVPLLLNNLGTGRVLVGDADTAIDLLREAAVGIPQHSAPPLVLAAALGLKSESAAAGAAMRRAVELCPAFGTLSGLRNWVRRQARSDFMPIYQHTIERGLQQAGMTEE